VVHVSAAITEVTLMTMNVTAQPGGSYGMPVMSTMTVCVCGGPIDGAVGECYASPQCPVGETSSQMTSMSKCCCPQQGQGWRDTSQCHACPPPSSGNHN